MSFTYKKRGSKDYLYFQAGTQGTYYIAPKDDPSKVNLDGVQKSLNYMLDRIEHDYEIVDRLLSFLPENLKRQYLQKEERRRLGEKEITSRKPEYLQTKVLETVESVLPLASRSFNAPSVKKLKAVIEELKKEFKEDTK
ncbi:MAG: hypothetical protein QXU32_07585 [Nitrososphaerales archaeon]